MPDVIAEGVIAAVKEVGLQVPLVVRLEADERRTLRQRRSTPTSVPPDA